MRNTFFIFCIMFSLMSCSSIESKRLNAYKIASGMDEAASAACNNARAALNNGLMTKAEAGQLCINVLVHATISAQKHYLELGKPNFGSDKNEAVEAICTNMQAAVNAQAISQEKAEKICNEVR